MTVQRTATFVQRWSVEIATVAATLVVWGGVPGFQVLGAVWLLLLAPGWQAARGLGLRALPVARGERAALILAVGLSLALSPVIVYWSSLLFGFRLLPMTASLAGVTLALGVAARWRPVAPILSLGYLFERSRYRRLALVLLALLAVLITLTYLQVRSGGALFPPFISDYAKQHTVIDLIERSGVPPRALLYPPWQDRPFVYPYFFHLLAASLRLLAGYSLNILAAFTLTAVTTALAFASLLAVLARALHGRERPALLSLLFVTVVGGLDLLPLAAQGLANAARDGLTAQALLVSLGVDGWLAPAQRGGIGSFYHFYTWVPQHLAAGLVYVLGVALYAVLGRRSRRLAGLLPFLLLALAGYSVYVALPVIVALLFYAIFDSGRAMLARPQPQGSRQRWRPLLTWLAIACASVLVAWPYLADLWRVRQAETAGLAFAVASNGLDWLDGAFFRQIFGPRWWAHLMDAPLYFLLELGALLVFGLWGWWVYVQRGRGESQTQSPPDGQVGWPAATQSRSAANFLLLAALVAAAMVLLLSSRGAALGITWNDLRMRAVLLLEVFLACSAGLGLEQAWNGAGPLATRRLRRGLAVALLTLGLAATAWDFTGLGLARFVLDKHISADEMGAYDFLRRATESDAVVQGVRGRDRSLHLYADRMSRVDAGMLSQMHVPSALLSADYAAVQAALTSASSAEAWRLLRQLDVDYLFVGPEERQVFAGNPEADLPALRNPSLFRPVYDTPHYDVFQVAAP